MSVDETVPPEITPPVAGSYEFGEGENRVFEGLARRARSVGFWFMVYGGILVIGFLSTVVSFAGLGRFGGRGGVSINIDLSTLISGLVFLSVGYWSRRSAQGFDAVAKTRGGDVGHLMGALKELSKLYGLLEWVVFAVVVVMVVAMVVALVLAVSR